MAPRRAVQSSLFQACFEGCCLDYCIVYLLLNYLNACILIYCLEILPFQNEVVMLLKPTYERTKNGMLSPVDYQTEQRKMNDSGT